MLGQAFLYVPGVVGRKDAQLGAIDLQGSQYLFHALAQRHLINDIMLLGPEFTRQPGELSQLDAMFLEKLPDWKPAIMFVVEHWLETMLIRQFVEDVDGMGKRIDQRAVKIPDDQLIVPRWSRFWSFP